MPKIPPLYTSVAIGHTRLYIGSLNLIRAIRENMLDQYKVSTAIRRAQLISSVFIDTERIRLKLKAESIKNYDKHCRARSARSQRNVICFEMFARSN